MEMNAFIKAVEDSKTLSEKPSNETLLNLYSLYKQATEGDVNGEAPAMFDFVAKAKYEAWSSLKGTSKEAAMNDYVKLVDKLKNWMMLWNEYFLYDHQRWLCAICPRFI